MVDSGGEYDDVSDGDLNIPEIILDAAATSIPSRGGLSKSDRMDSYFSAPINLNPRGKHHESHLTNTYNTTSLDLDIDMLEDKPWRKPGVDITDYFNYGFNEDTWREYCKRQQQMRIENQVQGKISVYASGDDQYNMRKRPQQTEDMRQMGRRIDGAPHDMRRTGYRKFRQDEETVIPLVGDADDFSERMRPEFREPIRDEYREPYRDEYRDDRKRDKDRRPPDRGYGDRDMDRERERDREKRDRDRERDMERDRERERDRDKDRSDKRDSFRDRERDVERDRERERDRDRGKRGDIERDRDRGKRPRQ